MNRTKIVGIIAITLVMAGTVLNISASETEQTIFSENDTTQFFTTTTTNCPIPDDNEHIINLVRKDNNGEVSDIASYKCLNTPIPEFFPGDWYLAKELTNPWPDGSIAKSHDDCIAQIDLDSGEGTVDAWSFMVESWAQISIALQEEYTAYRWYGDDTNGRIILRDPSYAEIWAYSWLGQGARSYISITVKEYNPDWSYNRNWHKEVFSYTGDNEEFVLDGYYIDFELQTDYLYTVEVFARAEQYGSSSAGIDPIKFKKIWWAFEKETETNLQITHPELGAIYLFDRHIGDWALSYPVFLVCNGVYVNAVDPSMAIKRVRFECGGDVYESHSDTGFFTGRLQVNRDGRHTLTASGYDANGNLIDTEGIFLLTLFC